jgi:hypothetical protein
MAAAAATQIDVIKFDPILKCFKRDGVCLKGLLPEIHTRFCPSYDFTKATHNRDPRTETEYQERRRKKANAKTQLRGFNTGIKLDKEISRTVEIFVKHPHLSLAVFYSKKVRDATNMPLDDRQFCDRLMGHTKRFWHHCNSRGLLPYETQTVLLFKHIDIAHPLDVLCLDAAGGTWIIEVKSGYDGYLDACTENHMRPPLQNQTDSKANQHQIQLAAQRELFIKNMPNRQLAGCFILHLSESTAKEYPLKEWAKRIEDWETLLAENRTTTKKRNQREDDNPKRKKSKQ